ncbi:hypothetical protein B0H66DRAFT_540140 [Apodospora peruviana]|uniref:Xylanolytic transcriptional activator regulatory domain-containing protein n=1 Tax=Apodospora peruviana TaxID=516989 RepID=A0AAE0MDZ7_9PEZI|nr:hypothetical protein B0H66DRAFT_540140 [Apodospora peruviana]
MDSSVKERLESELGADAETFASRMHAAAEKLSASIPPGEGGLVHVQQLFLKAFWFKSAERWTEAWHAVGAATRATIEIGLHQDSLSEGMSEFDREMRRRLWGILYVWDFALGSMLSRPRLINHADCTFVSPTLALEVDPENPDQPSPYGHMKLHCKLALDMAAQLASVSNKAISTEVALRLRNVVQQYFKDLPRVYALRNPDTSWDKEHGWIVFQHRYLHLMGYMSLFDHLKPYITRNSAKLMTDVEKTLRAVGVEAALSLMDVSWTFFDNMASVGAKFHYAAFCIFDTATVLCLAFVYDEARNLPQRETVLEAIRKGLNMLEELRTASRTSASLCRILKGLLAKLPLSPKEKVLISAPKRGKSDNRSLERSGNQTTGSSSDFGSSPLRSESNQSAAASSISPTSGTISLGSSEVDAEGVKPWSGGGQSGCSSHSPVVSPDGLYDGPSGGLQSATADLVPVDQTEWPVLEVTDMNLLQDVNLAAFEETAMPTALQLWDWQGLGLDIPEFFGNHPPM